jgi:hypothetical protein
MPVESGDICFLQIKFRNSDAKKVDAILGSNVEYLYEGCKGTVVWEEGQANSGMTEERKALAAAGVIFEGRHGAGELYPARVFCGIGGESYEVETFFDRDRFMSEMDLESSMGPVVRFDIAKGEVDAASLAQVRKFREAVMQVRQAFESAKDIRPGS